jgi:hypothetical protein
MHNRTQGAAFGELEYFPTSLYCAPIQYIGESAFLIPGLIFARPTGLLYANSL